jgi:hypothetical protein
VIWRHDSSIAPASSGSKPSDDNVVQLKAALAAAMCLNTARRPTMRRKRLFGRWSDE